MSEQNLGRKDLGIGQPLKGDEQEVIIRNDEFRGRIAVVMSERRSSSPKYVATFSEELIATDYTREDEREDVDDIPVIEVEDGIKKRVVGVLRPIPIGYRFIKQES